MEMVGLVALACGLIIGLGAGQEAALTFGVKVAFGELLKVMLMVAGFVLVFKFHPGLDAIA
ncbi:MAG: hypothetical protein ABIU95_01650, partial [Burkholderiales bacterium]